MELEGVVHERAADETVIDVDFHLHVPVDHLFEYVKDSSIRKKLENFGAPKKPTNGLVRKYASEQVTEEDNHHMRAHGIAVNRDEIGRIKDVLEVDRVVVSPGTHLPFTGVRYPTIVDELISAYNDYVVDRVIDVENGIYAALTVPIRRPEKGVAELERLGSEDGFVGAQNFLHDGEPLGAHEHDRVFEEIVSRGLPLLLHPMGTYQKNDIMSNSFRTHPAALTTGVARNSIANAMKMIMTGVFDAFPGLEVVVQEAGIYWIPYAAYLGDEFYQSYS